MRGENGDWGRKRDMGGRSKKSLLRRPFRDAISPNLAHARLFGGVQFWVGPIIYIFYVNKTVLFRLRFGTIWGGFEKG